MRRPRGRTSDLLRPCGTGSRKCNISYFFGRYLSPLLIPSFVSFRIFPMPCSLHIILQSLPSIGGSSSSLRPIQTEVTRQRDRRRDRHTARLVALTAVIFLAANAPPTLAHYAYRLTQPRFCLSSVSVVVFSAVSLSSSSISPRGWFPSPLSILCPAIVHLLVRLSFRHFRAAASSDPRPRLHGGKCQPASIPLSLRPFFKTGTRWTEAE